jgi:hypothetical protein
MPNPHATSTCLDGCDLSWTAGMPVHPEPVPGVRASRLQRKDLREMVVLAAVCVISTIVFVPPLAGVLWSPEPAMLASRDLNGSSALVFAAKPGEVTMVAMAATTSPAVRTVSGVRREPAGAERRPLAARIGRALAGDGRHRVQPFPRPSE